MPGGEYEPPVEIAVEDLEDLDDFDSLTGFGDDVEAHLQNPCHRSYNSPCERSRSSWSFC